MNRAPTTTKTRTDQIVWPRHATRLLSKLLDHYSHLTPYEHRVPGKCPGGGS
jgi:hypothetical protein